MGTDLPFTTIIVFHHQMIEFDRVIFQMWVMSLYR